MKPIVHLPRKPAIRAAELVPPSAPARVKPVAERISLRRGKDSYAFSYEGPVVEGAISGLMALQGANISRARVIDAGKRMLITAALPAGASYGTYQSFITLVNNLHRAGDVVDLTPAEEAGR